MTDFPDLAPARPVWLVTLADLALLLVGCFVLFQATSRLDPHALASGVRERFGGERPAALPVAASGVFGFAPGSAALAGGTDDAVAFARDAVRDPRVTLTVTGSVDGSSGDVDPVTHSATILAADRARAVAAVLAAHHLPFAIATATRPGRRAAIVTLAFTGERKSLP